MGAVGIQQRQDGLVLDPLNRPPSTGSTTVPRPPNLYGAEGNFPIFRCPTNPPPGQYVTVCLLVAYGQAGVDYPAGWTGQNAHIFSSNPGGLILGRSNYTGVAGYYARSQLQGLGCPGCEGFFSHKSDAYASLGRCPDGTSNTLLFGEITGGHIAWNGSGGLASGLSGWGWACGFNYTGFGAPESGPLVIRLSMDTPIGTCSAVCIRPVCSFVLATARYGQFGPLSTFRLTST